MKSLLAPRFLRFESLESRDLLAGNVTVELKSGALYITGDSQDNVVDVERIADIGNKLLITPDSTTSINGGQPGVAITVAAGDVIGDGFIDMLGGSDRITLSGGQFGETFNNLRITPGSGADQIDLEFCTVKKSLVFDNSGGTDDFSMLSCTVGSSSSAGSLSLHSSGGRSSCEMTDVVVTSPSSKSISTVKFENMDCTMDHVQISGKFSSTGSGGGSGGAAGQLQNAYMKMTDCLVSSFSLAHTGGALDFSAERVHFSDLSFTVDATGPTVSVTKSQVGLSDVDCDGRISITIKGEMSLSTETCGSNDLYMKLDRAVGQTSPSSLSLVDTDVTRVMSLSSRGTVDVTNTRCSASDYLLKIDGIKAEPLARSTVAVDGSTFTRLTCTCTCATDFSSDSSSFFSVSGDLSPPTGISKIDSFTWKMSACVVTDSLTLNSRGGETDVDCGGSRFASLYMKLQGIDGSSSKVSLSDLTVTKSLSLVTSGDVDVSLDTCKSSDLYIKLDRISKAQPLSSVSLLSCDTSNRFTLDSRGAVDVSLDTCAMFDSYMKIDTIKGEAFTVKVDVIDSSSNRMSITCACPSEMSFTRSSFHDISISSPTTSSLTTPAILGQCTTLMDDCVVDGTLSLTCSSSSCDVSVSNSRCASLYMKLECPIDASSVSLSSLSVSSSLSLVTRGSFTCTVDNAQASTVYLKMVRASRLADNSAVSLTACAVTTSLSLEGSGGVDFSDSGGRFAKVIMKLDGIKGESHRQTISLDGTFASTLSISSTETQDLLVSRAVLKSFFMAGDTPTASQFGALIDSSSTFEDVSVEGDFTFRASGASHRFSWSGGDCDDASISINAPSGRSSSVAISDLNADGHMDLVTVGECDMTVDNCAASDMYMKFDRLTSGQPGTSSLTMSFVRASNAIQLDDRGSMDVDVSSCRSSDIFMKIEGVKGERRTSSMKMDDCVVLDSISVASTCPVDLTVTGNVSSDLFIKLGRVTGNPADGSKINVSAGEVCDDQFSLVTSDGADVIVIDDLTVHGRSTVSLGGGDDRMDIQDEDCDGFASFDGGSGADRVTLVDCVFASSPQFSAFEQISPPLSV